jgi:hypothetical protein
MRKKFQSLFPKGSSLRNLASEIANYQCQQARQNCFFSAKPPPFNFLANGETTGYKPLTPPINCPLEIAEWKFHTKKINCCLAQGFNEESSSNRGLALLFDPLVDAVLNANIGKGSSPQKGSTVIVLSDYGAIYDLGINVIGYNGSVADWGLEEAQKTLRPPMPHGRIVRKQVSPTLINLWDCLCGDNKWQEHGNAWLNNNSPIRDAIKNRNVLIWNFMPFFRGGSGSAADAELPDPKCNGWLQTCLDWLGDFVENVGAYKVVFCVNKKRIIQIPSKHDQPVSLSDFNKPKNLRGITPGKLAPLFKLKQGGVFVLNHPSSWWRKSSNDCSSLKEIIHKDIHPSDILDQPVDE